MQEPQETRVWSMGWKDSLEEGMATHPSISGLENPMDRGAWRATVHQVSKSRTQLEWLGKHAHACFPYQAGNCRRWSLTQASPLMPVWDMTQGHAQVSKCSPCWRARTPLWQFPQSSALSPHTSVHHNCPDDLLPPPPDCTALSTKSSEAGTLSAGSSFSPELSHMLAGGRPSVKYCWRNSAVLMEMNKKHNTAWLPNWVLRWQKHFHMPDTVSIKQNSQTFTKV